MNTKVAKEAKARKLEEEMRNNCADCVSPMEAASMGINPCRHCDVTENCRRADCAAWKVFAEKGKEAATFRSGSRQD